MVEFGSNNIPIQFPYMMEVPPPASTYIIENHISLMNHRHKEIQFEDGKKDKDLSS